MQWGVNHVPGDKDNQSLLHFNNISRITVQFTISELSLLWGPTNKKKKSITRFHNVLNVQDAAQTWQHALGVNSNEDKWHGAVQRRGQRATALNCCNLKSCAAPSFHLCASSVKGQWGPGLTGSGPVLQLKVVGVDSTRVDQSVRKTDQVITDLSAVHSGF